MMESSQLGEESATLLLGAGRGVSNPESRSMEAKNWVSDRNENSFVELSRTAVSSNCDAETDIFPNHFYGGLDMSTIPTHDEHVHGNSWKPQFQITESGEAPCLNNSKLISIPTSNSNGNKSSIANVKATTAELDQGSEDKTVDVSNDEQVSHTKQENFTQNAVFPTENDRNSPNDHKSTAAISTQCKGSNDVLSPHSQTETVTNPQCVDAGLATRKTPDTDYKYRDCFSFRSPPSLGSLTFSSSSLRIESRLEELDVKVQVSKKDHETSPSDSSISTFSTQSTLTDFCRICHCDGDAELGPLIAPCHCRGSLRYVHQACLQQWIKTSDSKRCELCGYPFIMDSKLKPFHKWKKLSMSTTERRKIMCSVMFHIIAITCVIWSLYVLIERTANEIKVGQLQWPFWTKLVVVAIGFTGGLVFMYVQCKVYVQLWKRLRAFNRVIYVKNNPPSGSNTPGGNSANDDVVPPADVVESTGSLLTSSNRQQNYQVSNDQVTSPQVNEAVMIEFGQTKRT